MLVRDEVKNIITKACESAVNANKLENTGLPEIRIEYPKEERFGDYASSFALESAKLLRKSPIEIGNTMKEFIEGSKIIEKVEVVKPGFINIFLSTDFLHQCLMNIRKEADQYGKFDKKNPERINIEFVSANPTGPLNVVSARAAAVGDTIANLLEAAGNTVDREYYINDHGNQVYLLGKSVLARYRELSGEEVEFPEQGYQGEYIKEIAEECGKYSDEINTIADEDELIDFFAAKAIEHNVAGQKNDLESFNINYRTFFSEKTLHRNGDVESTLALLEEKGMIYEEEGKKIFRSTDFGDDKDRVVVREDGRPTYLLADIAYHKNKIDRGYDRLIDIWGPDHHGYIARLKGAIQAMGHPEDKLKILIVQQVNLLMQGEIKKMSKRLGKFSLMKDLIGDIGTDVARYFFIMRTMDSHLDFDIELAKRESSENPVFYLQYAHARICSIFREAEKRGFKYNPEKSSTEHLNNPETISLMKLMVRFPEDIYDAAEKAEPHRIASYLLKLAQKYHKFYTEHRVLSDDSVMTNTYLALCEGVKIILKNGLHLLGISAPESM
ncbi:MAG: arginine--tRNA ligase [Spirochaetes bacterium]|nr:arginine--tRNA ligase [Spirochaetota bacterium]